MAAETSPEETYLAPADQIKILRGDLVDTKRELDRAKHLLSFRLVLRIDDVAVVAARLEDLAVSCLIRDGVLELLEADQLNRGLTWPTVELSLLSTPRSAFR